MQMECGSAVAQVLDRDTARERKRALGGQSIRETPGLSAARVFLPAPLWRCRPIPQSRAVGRAGRRRRCSRSTRHEALGRQSYRAKFLGLATANQRGGAGVAPPLNFCSADELSTQREKMTKECAKYCRESVRAYRAYMTPTPYFTAFTMSKIGRYIATTMPPTTTPKNTIMIGSNSDSNALTAASTSSS